jgi:PAS domain S-box-containing protein/putative nucleotidyltransferase with HDIG domain
MIKKVLIVDDISTNLYMLETLLKGYGMEVTSAENGKDALDKARLNPPDLIITDILMPVMDGYALCRQWKSDDNLKHIPLVFYTATYTDPKDEVFALSLGADGFILKPQEPDIFINILKEVLGEKYAARQVVTKPLGEEMEFFRQYNEILFKKLENKMSDLQVANQELRILEERYRLSFENVTDVIYMTDTDLNIINMSPSVERILGYKPQDFIGRPVSDLGNILTPESFNQALADIDLVLKGKIIPAAVYQFIAKDGIIKYGEVSGSAIMHENKIIGIISVARDITDRKRTEEALGKSEKKYCELYDFLPIPVYEMDFEANITAANRAIYETFRGTEEDFKRGFKGWQLLSPEDVDKSAKNIQRLLKGEQIGGTEYNLMRLDGSVFPAIVISSLIYSDGKPVGLRGAIVDITQRKQVEKQLQDTLESLRKAVGTTIQVMVSAVETRDPYTAGHQVRTANLARTIATEMGLSQEKIEGIRMAGYIHDIGKLSIPAEILSKPTKLSGIEFSLIKEHARQGYEILKNVDSPWPLAEIVYQHHERMDGSGYPRRLKGNDILIEARILTVADVVEAMASHRPYRPALGIDVALEEIEKNRGTFYDKAVVDACLRLFREKGVQLEGT